jgi:L-2-amino-thiazoline-4-carboxylic acid hydrolase
MASAFASFARDDALDYNVRAQSKDIYAVDVTGCRYAQFYKELGKPELGFLLACSSDFTASALRHGRSANQSTSARFAPRGALAAKRGWKISLRSQLAGEAQAIFFVLALAGLQGLKKIKCLGCRGTDPPEFSDARQLRPNVIFDRPKLRVRLRDLTPEPLPAGLTPEPLSARLTAEPQRADRGHAEQTSASKAFCSHRQLGVMPRNRGCLLSSNATRPPREVTRM